MKIKLPDKVLDLLNYVIIFKPISLILVLIAVVGGYSTAAIVEQGSPIWWNFAFNFKTFINFMAPVLFSGGIFILNQNNHYKNSDLLNNFSPIENGEINLQITQKIAMISIIIALAGLLLVQELFLALFAAVIIGFRGYLYNFLNISRKETRLYWTIANLIFGVLLFGYGWRIGTSNFAQFFQYLLPYSAYMISILILIPLLEGDILYEKLNPEDEMIYYKNKKLLIWFSALLGIGGFLLALQANDPASAHALLLAIVLYLFLAINLNRLWILRTISYSSLFMVFFLGSEFPFLLIFSIICYFISKKYHRDKYEAEYPNFGTLRTENQKNKSEEDKDD